MEVKNSTIYTFFHKKRTSQLKKKNLNKVNLKVKEITSTQSECIFFRKWGFSYL